MDQNLAIVVIMAAAMVAAVLLTLFTARAKSRTRIAELTAQAGRESTSAARLSDENAQLRKQVTKQEERLRVLERIATDPAQRISREIDELHTN